MRIRHTIPALLALVALPLGAQTSANKANWQLAEKFSTANLRSKIFTSAVNPRWLGQSDSLCYDWKDHTGSTFFLVVPTTKLKKSLFDQTDLIRKRLAELGVTLEDRPGGTTWRVG